MASLLFLWQPRLNLSIMRKVQQLRSATQPLFAVKTTSLCLSCPRNTQVWKCAVSVTPDKRDFTCWYLYAVGVNLNSQDQEKCAGIHFMLLVQLGKQAEIISVAPVVWMVKFIDSRNPAEAQFRVAWRDTRAVRCVQTDVRINSSKRCFFLSERTFYWALQYA